MLFLPAAPWINDVKSRASASELLLPVMALYMIFRGGLMLRCPDEEELDKAELEEAASKAIIYRANWLPYFALAWILFLPLPALIAMWSSGGGTGVYHRVFSPVGVGVGSAAAILATIALRFKMMTFTGEAGIVGIGFFGNLVFIPWESARPLRSSACLPFARIRSAGSGTIIAPRWMAKWDGLVEEIRSKTS